MAKFWKYDKIQSIPIGGKIAINNELTSLVHTQHENIEITQKYTPRKQRKMQNNKRKAHKFKS